ncbi:MAG TPA: Ig-like domain-containing protein, partial [Gemmatimonadales bacterium]
RAAGSAVLTVAGYGMTGATAVVVHRPVQSLTITPSASGGALRLVPRTSRRFEVLPLAADSTPVREASAAWNVGDGSVARFDPGTGTLTALRPGTTTLAAVVEGFAPVTWQVEVVPGRVSLDRARFGLVLGARDSLRATLTDESGEPVDGVAPAFTWSSSSPSVVVSGDGAVEARALGRATVTATSEWGTAASAELFVTGDLLVASSRGGATPQSLGIHQIPPGSGELVTIHSDGAANIEPAWSPDRSRIAFSSSRAGTFDLYVMDADGANVTRVTADSGSESAPAWSPDGTRLYFVSDQGGGSAIESVAPDGSGRAAVASGPGGHRTPAVARDGRVAFASARDGNFEIYVAGADGGNVQRVTTNPAREHYPRWLPGGVLAYVADAARGGSAIVRLGAEGASRIVESPDPIVSLAVAPDGSRIAWVAGRMLDRSGSEIEYRLEVRPLAGTAAPIVIRGAPAEQLATPSF